MERAWTGVIESANIYSPISVVTVNPASSVAVSVPSHRHPARPPGHSNASVCHRTARLVCFMTHPIALNIEGSKAVSSFGFALRNSADYDYLHTPWSEELDEAYSPNPPFRCSCRLDVDLLSVLKERSQVK